jgi:heat shock protein HtpX
MPRDDRRSSDERRLFRGTTTRLDIPRDWRRTFVPRPTYDADAFGRLSERIARFLGTGQFLVYMTATILFWVGWNIFAPANLRFDQYPFIFLTLALSLQASYAAPLILLAQNRQEARDRVQYERDRDVDARTRADMEFLAREMASLRMAVGEVAPDRGLSSRMLITSFLLGLLYVGFVALLIALTKSAVLAVVIAGGALFVQYWFSDRIALYAMHGRIVTPEEAPELHGTIDRLCALADMPKPRVAIADVDLPNAFATGRNPKNAVVCVTTGIMRRLDQDELEGVLSHELSHVAHRDVAVMTIASFLGVLAGLITRFGLYGGLGRNRDQNTAVIVLTVIAVSIAVYAISFLLTRALSRYRELAADRAGAMLTGRPSALASALTKISGDIARIPSRDLRQAEPFNAFFFAPAISGKAGASLSSLFSTHPSLEKRLDRLGVLSRELGEQA